MRTRTTSDIDHDTPTTSTVYAFDWHPSENTDPRAVTCHREGTIEEARLCADTYQATIDLFDDGVAAGTIVGLGG